MGVYVTMLYGRTEELSAVNVFGRRRGPLGLSITERRLESGRYRRKYI